MAKRIVPTVEKLRLEVNTVAIALEREELDGDPDLQPPLMPVYQDHNGYSQIHPTASHYWELRRMLAEREQPITDLRAARNHLASVRASLKDKQQHRREGYSGSSNIRRLIDLEVLCDFALRDVRAIEARHEQDETAAGVVRRIPRRKPAMRSV
jgi:hypothetical protein